MSGKRGMLHDTEEMKEQVREEYAKGTSIHELSRKYGVSRWSIHCWCGLSEKVNLKQVASLRKGRPRKSPEKLGAAHPETTDGKRTAAKFSLSRWKKVKPSLKYRLMEQHVGKYPIQEMCSFFEVSRSGYYRCLQHKGSPDQDTELGEMIQECQNRRGKIHGYRYIQLWLEREKNIRKNPKTVLRVMRKYGLLCEIRRPKWKGCGQALHRYPNVLNRDFHADKPNCKWVTDISYIPTDQGFLYLSVIRDLFDNSIIAYGSIPSIV